jgi:hypothetical protein
VPSRIVVGGPQKVIVLSTSVTARRTTLAGARPSTTGWPVIKPIIRMAGTVRPMVEEAAPRHRLTARCNWLSSAEARSLPQDVNTIRAINTPPMAGGAFSRAIPWSTSFASCLANSTIGNIVTMSSTMCRPTFPSDELE